MIKYYPILCDYIEGNMLVKETITITGAGASEASRNTDKMAKRTNIQKLYATY